MQNKALKRIQHKVKTEGIIIRPHAYKAMADDGFYTADIFHGILSGKIVDRQHDFLTGEKKYVIHGNSTQVGRKIGIVLKELSGIIIITVFKEL